MAGYLWHVIVQLAVKLQVWNLHDSGHNKASALLQADFEMDFGHVVPALEALATGYALEYKVMLQFEQLLAYSREVCTRLLRQLESHPPWKLGTFIVPEELPDWVARYVVTAGSLYTLER